MPDENVMEIAHPDAPTPDANPSAASATNKEEDSSGEDARAAQDIADAGDDPDAEAETGTTEDLKVVVSIKGDRATIGVKGTSSDPHIESFDDPDLSGLAQEVPAVVERARTRWEDAPKYPAHVKPAPPAKRRSQRGQGTAQAATEGGEGQQQAEALRLF